MHMARCAEIEHLWMYQVNEILKRSETREVHILISVIKFMFSIPWVYQLVRLATINEAGAYPITRPREDPRRRYKLLTYQVRACVNVCAGFGYVFSIAYTCTRTLWRMYIYHEENIKLLHKDALVCRSSVSSPPCG